MSRLRPLLAALLLVWMTARCRAQQPQSDFSLSDPGLRAVSIDQSPGESFLSLRVDASGRLFVGGREGLFVYEPQVGGRGGYGPRQELYRFPKGSWVYDIEIRGNDLYVLTLSALYLFPDGVVRRAELQPRRLLWGPPDWHVHQAFHGLAWGPEGDLYISMGDLLVFYGDYQRADHWGHWTMFSQPAGTRTPYTGVGGVFRCRPDGTRLQVVAGGTRNSCGLVFDTSWNLFSNDNDHEGLPTEYVPGRILHVTPHADFGWPRGWMVRKTPQRADLLETVAPDLGRAVPVGQTYYDEAYLPARYRNNLLVARWGSRAVARYPLSPRGASFSSREQVLLQGYGTTRPVGVAVGRGGRVFVALASMAHNEGSPVYPSELVMITRSDDPDHHPFQPIDLVNASTGDLARELARGSSWPARRAHQELLRRLEQDEEPLRVVEPVGELAGKPNAGHALWLAAAAAARGGTESVTQMLARLRRLTTGADQDLAVQALRIAVEYWGRRREVSELMVAALNTADPRLQHAAVVGLFSAEGPLPKALWEGPARSVDTYLRQTAAILLARRATPQQLATLCASEDPRTRLAGVLATGFRLTLPRPTASLDAELPLADWPTDAPYIVPYATEVVDLRKHGRLGMFTTAEHWAAGRQSGDQRQAFALLTERLEDTEDNVRVQAAHFLMLLNDTRVAERVRQVRQRSQRERLQRAPLTGIGELWIAGPFVDGQDGFGKVHPPEQGPVDLAARYAGREKSVRWEKVKQGRMFDFRERYGVTDGTSVYAFFRLESPRAEQAMLLPGSDDGLKIWLNGTEVVTKDRRRAALPLQDVVYLDLQAGSNEVLLRVRNRVAQHQLYLHYRSLAGAVKWSLPERLDQAGLSERLALAAAGKQVPVPAELLKVDWAAAARLGNPQRGRKLFSAEGLGCAKCHATQGQVGVQGGPSLAAAAARLTVPYLVEAVLLPSRKVSPVFRASQIVTTEGKVHQGLVLSENAEHLQLLTPAAKRLQIPLSGIAERQQLQTSPMPAGLVKKRSELADLLAFLGTQKPAATGPTGRLEVVGPNPYGRLSTGEMVDEYTLTNAAGIEVRLINYGATVTSLRTPDRAGKRVDIVLGYDDLSGYLGDPISSGCIVGRFANRIAGAQFTIDGNRFALDKNFRGGHHLHGGTIGFQRRVWVAQRFQESGQVGVIFRYTSPDGEAGYPGRLKVVVRYSLNQQNELSVGYEARTDKSTHVNLTQHSYFNLRGHDAGDVLDHRLRLHCDRYLPVEQDGVPTGQIASVTETPFDFRRTRSIGSRIRERAGLYDHQMVLAEHPIGVVPLARVSEPHTGRVLEILTDQPGAQFYTSIHMNRVLGRGGTLYRKYAGLCLETQHFPDSPNRPEFPSTLLQPGEVFESQTIYRFGTQ